MRAETRLNEYLEELFVIYSQGENALEQPHRKFLCAHIADGWRSESEFWVCGCGVRCYTREQWAAHVRDCTHVADPAEQPQGPDGMPV